MFMLENGTMVSSFYKSNGKFYEVEQHIEQVDNPEFIDLCKKIKEDENDGVITFDRLKLNLTPRYNNVYKYSMTEISRMKYSLGRSKEILYANRVGLARLGGALLSIGAYYGLSVLVLKALADKGDGSGVVIDQFGNVVGRVDENGDFEANPMYMK